MSGTKSINCGNRITSSHITAAQRNEGRLSNADRLLFQGAVGEVSRAEYSYLWNDAHLKIVLSSGAEIEFYSGSQTNHMLIHYNQTDNYEVLQSKKGWRLYLHQLFDNNREYVLKMFLKGFGALGVGKMIAGAASRLPIMYK